MVEKEDKYLSIKLARFFMKVVGLWDSKTRREQIEMNLCLLYTTAAILFAIVIEGFDLYKSWGNFDAVAYNLCATMSMVLVFVKLSIFMIRRDDVNHLIRYFEKNVWEVSYNDFGQQILKECDKKGFIFVSIYIIFCSSTVINYIVAPMVENIGRNATDRVLPFKVWWDLPLSTTPYYEIFYSIQSLSTCHSGICFFCFDNMLSTFAIQTVGQIKILQQRLRIICDKYFEMKTEQDKEKKSPMDMVVETEIYAEFKSCIDQHRILIDYIDTLESVFNLILLCQTMAKLTIVRRFIFMSLAMTCFTQLFLITWTCNELTLESTKIGDSAYGSRWYAMPQNKIGRSFKSGLLILIVRVRRPLFLSAGKFFSMSLDTFGAILRTALSYFTLMRQMQEEIDT